jgi:hypothetical protein
MNIKHHAQTVLQDAVRVRVPGGWVYNFYCNESESVTFVPDARPNRRIKGTPKIVGCRR